MALQKETQDLAHVTVPWGLCYAMRYYATLCDAMLCDAMLCDAMLCHGWLARTTRGQLRKTLFGVHVQVSLFYNTFSYALVPE